MSTDDVATRTLMELGRRQGRVSTDDFRRLLPIASMSSEEIANLVLRLEERGIAVDLDPTLFVPSGTRREGSPSPADAVTLRPAPPSPPAPETRMGSGPPQAPQAPSPPPVGGFARGQSRTLWVIASTIIAVGLIVLLSFAMG